MKNGIFSWWCLLVSISSYGQVVTVRDSLTGKPLDLVVLVSENPYAFTTTNALGKADVSTFQDAQQIWIRRLGYQMRQISYADLINAGLELSLAPSGIKLRQIEISSSRWNLAGQRAPNKVALIEPDEVVLYHPQTSADMLGASGEVFIQKSQQGGGSPMIRGFAANRLLYSVDGVRMNTAIFRSGNLQNVISLDPLAMERTEVLFGPGSVIYGSDAIGGVMIFHTLRPQLSLSENTLVAGNALMRFASANTELTGHFDVNVGWKRWAIRSSLSYNHFGDLRMGRYGPDDYLRTFYVQRHDSADVVISNDDPLVQKPTSYSQINLMQKLRFKPSEAWNMEYALHYSTTTDYARYDRLIRTRNGLPRSAQWYYGPQVWMMNHLKITHHGGNAAYDEAVLHAAYQLFEESRHDRDFNDIQLRHRKEKVDAYSVNLDFIKSIRKHHHLFYGIEGVVDAVHSSGRDEDITTGVISVGPARYPQARWGSYAAYLSYEFKWKEKLILQTGFRYNYFHLHAEFDTAFYPFPFTEARLNRGAPIGNVGLIYHPAARWTLRASLASGFRAPNVDDAGKVFDSSPGSVIVPNPELKPEYAWNFEAGVAKAFGEVARIELTGFYTLLQQAMVRRNFQLNGMDSIIYDGELSQVQAIQNASSAYVYGVQAALEISFPKGFGLQSSFNWQRGREELDDGTVSPLRHAAPLFGITHFTYAVGRLKMDLYAVYSGRIAYENLSEESRGTPYLFAADKNGNPYSPAWYTLNFKARYEVTDFLACSAGVENITDQRYRTYSSGIAAAGRNFILSLQVRF